MRFPGLVVDRELGHGLGQLAPGERLDRDVLEDLAQRRARRDPDVLEDLRGRRAQPALDEGGLASLEEERRLFYVATTRAESKLTLSYATSRFKFGSLINCEPSRFLDEIDAQYLELDFTARPTSVADCEIEAR